MRKRKTVARSAASRPAFRLNKRVAVLLRGEDRGTGGPRARRKRAAGQGPRQRSVHRPRSRSCTRKISRPPGSSAAQQRLSSANCSSGGKILQHIQNQNQAGLAEARIGARRRTPARRSSALRACRATSMRCAFRSQPARRRPGLVEGRKAERHAVAAAQIDHCSRSQILGGEEGEDAVQAHLPAHKAAIKSGAVGKGAIDKANALAQAALRRRGPVDHRRSDRRADAAHQHAQHKLPSTQEKSLLLEQLRAGKGRQLPGLPLAGAQKAAQPPAKPPIRNGRKNGLLMKVAAKVSGLFKRKTIATPSAASVCKP